MGEKCKNAERFVQLKLEEATTFRLGKHKFHFTQLDMKNYDDSARIAVDGKLINLIGELMENRG
jgi:hypothetical protein